MHESIPLETRRNAKRLDRLIDDDAQVVLLPLHMVYLLILDHWSSIPNCRADGTSRCAVRAHSSARSALPTAFDALRGGRVGTGWTAGYSKRALRCDLVAFHLSSEKYGTSGRWAGSGGGRARRAGTWAATAPDEDRPMVLASELVGIAEMPMEPMAAQYHASSGTLSVMRKKVCCASCAWSFVSAMSSHPSQSCSLYHPDRWTKRPSSRRFSRLYPPSFGSRPPLLCSVRCPSLASSRSTTPGMISLIRSMAPA